MPMFTFSDWKRVDQAIYWPSHDSYGHPFLVNIVSVNKVFVTISFAGTRLAHLEDQAFNVRGGDERGSVSSKHYRHRIVPATAQARKHMEDYIAAREEDRRCKELRTTIERTNLRHLPLAVLQDIVDLITTHQEQQKQGRDK